MMADKLLGTNVFAQSVYEQREWLTFVCCLNMLMMGGLVESAWYKTVARTSAPAE
jgi:hypothetical protein